MIEIIPFKFPDIPNVRCAFTTRRGGQSKGPFKEANLSFEVGDDPKHVVQNRNMLLRSLSFDKIVELKQIHKDNIVEIKNVPSSPAGDAMITKEAKLGLLIKVADCQPILIAHISGKYIGAFHVGWRANRGNFIQKWIEIFCKTYNIVPRDIMAIRGPSLGPGNSEFINFHTEWGEEYLPYYNPINKTVDLWRLTKAQLKDAGLLEKNIFSIDLCTFDLEDYFFSYRREKLCGRQGGIIWKTD
jgi:YfiH family protein